MRRLLLVTLFAALLPAAPAAAHGVEGAITHRDTRDELAFVDVAATAATAAVPGALPYEWCGEARTTDDTAHAALPASSPRFKLVYAHPADRPDRFDGWRDALQGNVALIQRFLASQSGGAKALRVDMGTSCGPQYADIQVVHLSGPRSQYVDNFSAVVREVEPRLGQRRRPAQRGDPGRHAQRRRLRLRARRERARLGRRPPRLEQRPQLRRLRVGAVLARRPGRARAPAPAAGGRRASCTRSATTSAPCSGRPRTARSRRLPLPRYGHCWQGADVMCYTEDGGAAHAMQYDCPRVGGAIPQAYDCGRDDYFNPAPPAGSYLATHWNVYDSAFLAPCAQIAPACGGGTDGLAPTPPVATAAPELSGSPRRGASVGALAGAWRNGPLTFSYRWQRLQAQALDEHLRRHARVLRAQARATAAAGCACRSWPPTRTAALRPSSAPSAARGRRQGRPRAELHQRSVLQGPSSTACCQVPRS